MTDGGLFQSNGGTIDANFSGLSRAGNGVSDGFRIDDGNIVDLSGNGFLYIGDQSQAPVTGLGFNSTNATNQFTGWDEFFLAFLAGGDVNIAGVVEANQFGLSGPGATTATNALNDVNRIAFDGTFDAFAGIRGGSINLVDKDDLIIGDTFGFGLHQSGDVTITAGGDITIFEPINMGAFSTTTLNAGANAIIFDDEVLGSNGADVVFNAGSYELNVSNTIITNGSVTMNGGGIANVNASNFPGIFGRTVDLSPQFVVSNNATRFDIEGEVSVNFNSGSSITTDAANVRVQANRFGFESGDFNGIALNGATLTATGSANIDILAFGGDQTGNDGLRLDQASAITIGSGTLDVTATGVTNGISLLGGSDIFSTGGGAINLTGTGTNSGLFVNDAGSMIGSNGVAPSGDITLTMDSINLAAGSVASPGSNLTIATQTSGTSIGLGDGATGDLNLTAAEIGRFQNGFEEIYIGSEIAGIIEVQAATFLDPVTIEGDEIHVEGQLTGSDNASITLLEFAPPFDPFDPFGGGNGSSTTYLNAPIVTNGNAVTIDDRLLVGTNASIDTTNGGSMALGANVTFTQPVDSQFMMSNNLTINGGIDGVVTFQAPIGSDDPLSNLTIAAQTVNFDNNVSLSGDLTATLDNLSLTRSVTVGGNVDLEVNDGVQIDFFATLMTSGAGSIAINADANGDTNGTLTVFEEGTIASGPGGSISITAADVDFRRGEGQADINAGTGTVTLQPSTPGRTIDLGGTGGTGDFVATDAELDLITASSIRVGSASTGNVVFTAAVELANADTLEITTSGTVNDTGSSPAFISNSLAIIAAQGIGTTGALNTAVSNLEANGGTGGINVSNTGDVTVGGVSDSLTGLSATNLDISLAAASSITVSEAISGGTGNIILNADGGVTLSSSVTATGNGSIDIEAARQITVNGGAAVSSTTCTIVLDANSSGLTAGNFTGVFVADSATVSSTTGDITVTGHGGDAVNNGNHGVQLAGTAAVTSQGGNITLTGQAGGAGATQFHEGVIIGGDVTTTGSGNIT